MSTGFRMVATLAFGLAACGGGDSGGGVSLNAWTGTLNVAAGTASTTCVTTHLVVFSATGSNPLTVNAAVGDCLTARVDDGTTHQPVAREASGCGELDIGQIDPTTPSRTTAPFTAPKVCHWADLLNPPPPPPGGGGGGGVGY